MPERQPRGKIKLPSSLERLKNSTDKAEDGLRGVLYRWRLPIFVVAVTALAFWGRAALWPVVSGDFVECLHPWMDEIRAAQGFRSLHLQIGNYTAPYHYLMAFMSYIPGLNNLLVIKITSTIADFCMAGAGALLLLKLGAQKWQAALGYALLLCLPTVFLNSAAWGQCDAMFTALILLFFAAFLSERKGLALLLYGLALAVKLQAIFVLPAVLIFWLCGKLRLRHLLCGAGGYVLAFIPAMLASGSLSPLWRAYAMQARVMALSSNISNGASLFTGFIEDELGMLSTTLMLLCFVVLGALALYCWQHKDAFTKSSAFILLALCAGLVPYLLPAMKDRYFFPFEVLCLLYAMHRPRRFWLPLAMQLVSLPSYMFYLQNMENPFGRWLAVIAALPLLALWWDLRVSFGTPEAEELETEMSKDMPPV